MTDVLSNIASHVAKSVERLKRERPVEKLRENPLYLRRPLSFRESLSGPGLNVIAEVKFASPSEGLLRLRGEDSPERAASIASGYAAAGARAVSILTERNFFAGTPEFLAAARKKCPELAILMKDFIFDPYQLELARSCGADAVLLIVALLGKNIEGLLSQCRALGLSALVEVHDEAELALALSAGAEIIGVNSRNLKTLKTDFSVLQRLAECGKGAFLVAESGLSKKSELEELSKLGYRAFLIGSSLMKAPDPGAALKALLS
jgi:indole-3-glycerol phosphate synthase